MIRLEVEDYCHQCRKFEAMTVTRGADEILDPFENEHEDLEAITRETVVKCSNWKICKNLVRYLRKEADR